MRKSEDKKTGNSKRNRGDSSIPMFLVANLLPLLILLFLGAGLLSGKLTFRENTDELLEHIVAICILFGVLVLVSWVGAPIILTSISRTGKYLNTTANNIKGRPLRTLFSMPKFVLSVLLYPILIVNLIALVLMMLGCIGAIVFFATITIIKVL